MTRFMLLALVAVAIPAGAQTVEEVPQVTVNFAVTRLDTPVAVAAARSKIDRAAEDVCDTRARFLQTRGETSACLNEAMNRAHAELDRIINRRSPTTAMLSTR